MANPVIVTCAENTWTRVAENVTSATIYLLTNPIYRPIENRPLQYYQTYRNTGDAAPTDLTDAINVSWNDRGFEFSNPDSSDIYVYAVDAEGSVRVDR